MPSSPFGEIDLMAIENNIMSKALIEAKIFDGEKRSNSYIIKGFHQVYIYLKEYNENKDYLRLHKIFGVHIRINYYKPSIQSNENRLPAV